MTERKPLAPRTDELMVDAGAGVGVDEVAAALTGLRQQPQWRQGGLATHSLRKDANGSSLLIALKAGARLERHQASGEVIIRLVTGRIMLGLPDRSLCLQAGHRQIVEPGRPHDVEALTEAALLVTVRPPVPPTNGDA